MTVKVGFIGPNRKQNCWFSHAKAQSISLPKLTHAIYREFLSGVKIEEKNPPKKDIYNIFAKTLIVGTRYNRLAEEVLTSTHNVCFGSNIRKIGITL